MLSTTNTIIRAALKGDITLSFEQQNAILAAIQYVEKGKSVTSFIPIPRVISRQEVAKILGVSAQRVDQIKRMGALKSVILPGCSKAMGFTEASVRALAEGQTE